MCNFGVAGTIADTGMMGRALHGWNDITRYHGETVSSRTTIPRRFRTRNGCLRADLRGLRQGQALRHHRRRRGWRVPLPRVLVRGTRHRVVHGDLLASDAAVKRLAGLLALAAFLAPPTAGAQVKPNIVLVYTDDQSHQTVSAYGTIGLLPSFTTPNIDAIATQGSASATTRRIRSAAEPAHAADRPKLGVAREVRERRADAARRAADVSSAAPGRGLRHRVDRGRTWRRRPARADG